MAQPNKGITVGQYKPVGVHDPGNVRCLALDIGPTNTRAIETVTSLAQFLDDHPISITLPDGSVRRFTADEPPCVATVAKWLREVTPEYQALAAHERALATAPASAVRATVKYLRQARSGMPAGQ